MTKLILAGGTALALISGLAASSAYAGGSLPVGGQVSLGAAAISKSAGNVTINQASNRAVINWSSFAVGAGNNVVFNQPSAQSATLNRVTGNATSVIAGQISSNGAVYLVNPNGIAISKSGSIQTGGGFIASSLDISDNDFNADKLNFAGKGASATVSNAGHIAARNGAYVALLGGSVSNSGTIAVPYGRVGLGSAESIALDLNGGGFMQVALPTSALTGTAALIDNSGSVAASGGIIELRAATVKDAVRNVINMPGSLNADSATGNGGHITLFGGAKAGDWGGTVTASGTLSARATGSKGDGGLVETSGHTVNFAAITADTRAAHGKTGTWLVDPTDLTVGVNDAATINTSLATTSVVLQVNGDGSVSGTGARSPGNGDLNINGALSWSSSNALSLLSYNNININAAISAPNGILTLASGNGVPSAGAISDSAAVNVGIFNLANGSWYQNASANTNKTLPAFSATDFRVDLSNQNMLSDITNANFMRVLGGDGVKNPYQIADIYGLQGIAATKYLPSNFIIANNIDAAITKNWNAGLGFIPIGTDGFGRVLHQVAPYSSSGFSGQFNAAFYAINGLTINRPSYDQVGLFGYSSGVISYTVMTKASITGNSFVGGLVGKSAGSQMIGGLATPGVYASTVSGTITGGHDVGGLVGFLGYGTINASTSQGSVSSPTNVLIDTFIGGLVGENANGIIRNSISFNTVIANSALITAGGLVGLNSSVISQSSARGAVITNDEYGTVGGLVGVNYGTISQSFSSASVSGSSANPQIFGGLVGIYGGGIITQCLAIGSVTFNTPGTFGGLIGVVAPGYSSLVTNSFWDTQTTGQSTSAAGIGLTTAQLQNFNTYGSVYTGWDFAKVWAPPSQVGQAGQTKAYYPELYAFSPVISAVGSGSSTRVYSDINPAVGIAGGPGTYLFSPAGDTLPAITAPKTTAPTIPGVGTYTVTAPAGGTLTSTQGVVYRFVSGGSGTLTITPRPLYIYTFNTTSVYGTTPNIGYFNPTGGNYGLVNGDTVSGNVGGVTSTSGVGTYNITLGSLSASNNYQLIDQTPTATVTITPRPLYIYTFNTSSVYGTTPNIGYFNPTGGNYGLVNGDTVSGNVGGVTSTSGVGTYNITLGSLSASNNYQLIDQTPAATVTITPRPLYIYTFNTSSVYGTTPNIGYFNPTGGNYGLVNGDTVSGNVGGVTSTSGVGTYNITLGSLSASNNYQLIDQTPAATVTITPRPLYIYTFNTSSLYGTTPNIGYFNPTGGNYGLTNGDVLTGALGGASAASSVGNYAITLGSLSGGSNYYLSYQTPGAMLTITPRSLYIYANPISRHFGTANPILNYLAPTGASYGLVANDALSGSLATQATPSSSVGNYAITQGSLSASSNYTIIYTGANLTVTQ